MTQRHWITCAAIALFACGCATTPNEPLLITAKADVPSSPVVREVLSQPVVPAPVTATTTVTNPEVSTQPPVQGSALPATTAAAQDVPVTTPIPAGKPTLAKGTKAKSASKLAKQPGKKPAVAGAGREAGAAAESAGRMPPGTLYVCSGPVAGQNQQTAIEFEPRVKRLCARHPQMSVCQYEREACRASGGRVYTAAGEEITKKTEAEYDKKVMRVRFRAG